MNRHLLFIAFASLCLVACSKEKSTPPNPQPKPTTNNHQGGLDLKHRDDKKGPPAPKLPPLTLDVISPETDGTKTNPFPIKKALKFKDRTLHVIESKVCTFKSQEVCMKADFLTCKPKHKKDLVRVDILVNNTSKATIKHPLYPLFLELKDGSTVMPSARCPLLRRYSTLEPVKPGMPSYLTVLFEVAEGKTPTFFKYKRLKRDVYFKLSEGQKTDATP